MSIRFFNDRVKTKVSKRRNLIKFIEKVIREEKKIPGDLNFIFTDDEYLLSVNKEFLKHNYYTDVIAFNDSQNAIISGEVYLSVERIRENAGKYKVKVKEETLRVIIHAILHLCGYDDKSKRDKKEMREAEDRYLQLFKKENNVF